jgi:CHAD domain-containing protein
VDVNAQVGPPVVDFAARVLQKRHRQLRKRGKHIATLSPPERHAVRIAAKKLRYAAEFFLSLYPRKQTHEYIAALSGLQDVLGALNDAATTIALLQEIINGGEHDDSRQHAKGTIHGWILGMSHARLKDLERVWENFLDQTTFW